MRPDSLLKILEIFRRTMEVRIITGEAHLSEVYLMFSKLSQSVIGQWTMDTGHGLL